MDFVHPTGTFDQHRERYIIQVYDRNELELCRAHVQSVPRFIQLWKLLYAWIKFCEFKNIFNGGNATCEA
jgi:hypothetical protein